MKMYFSCSLTGGRADQKIYGAIVDYLVAQGHDVLTTHLAKPEVMAEEQVISPREVYERDIAWVKEADVLIAEVSTPSHGVGYEIAAALTLSKPVLCVYRQNARVSKMITGNTAPTLRVAAYDEDSTAPGVIQKFLETLAIGGPMNTQAIYNYRQVNDHLITGGQPNAEQLKAAAEEGYTTVVNLAPTNPQASMEDEEGLVHSLGMAYYHIPVAWDNPQDGDFQAFEQVMKACAADKMLIHCVANFRVTAFYSLYALKNLGWSEAQADEFRASIWQGSDYPVWERFIRQMKAQIIRS